MADKLKISGLYNPRVNEAPLYELKIGTKTTEEENNVVYRWVMCKVGVRKPISSTIKRKGVATKFRITPDMAGKKYDIVVYECTLIKDNKTNEDNKTIEDISEKISNDDLENVLKNGHKDIKVEFVDKKTIEIPEEKTTRHNIEPKILKVDFIKMGDGDPNKVSYQDTLLVWAETQDLQNKEITFKLLWNNDDEPKKVFKAKVDNKDRAEVKIPLITYPDVLDAFIKNKTSKDKSTEHTFKVEASFGEPPKTNGKKATQVKGEIKDAYFIDKNGEKVTKLKKGDVVRVCIESEGMINKYFQYFILEKDKYTPDDSITSSGVLTFKDDIFIGRPIEIDDEKLLWGGKDREGEDRYEQDYIIKVKTFKDSKTSKPKTLILEEEKDKTFYSKSPVKVSVREKSEKEKTPSTDSLFLPDIQIKEVYEIKEDKNVSLELDKEADKHIKVLDEKTSVATEYKEKDITTVKQTSSMIIRFSVTPKGGKKTGYLGLFLSSIPEAEILYANELYNNYNNVLSSGITSITIKEGETERPFGSGYTTKINGKETEFELKIVFNSNKKINSDVFIDIFSNTNSPLAKPTLSGSALHRFKMKLNNSEWHDPVKNPQVRGWYNKGTNINKKSKIKGWNPYASMLINSQTSDEDIKKYGKPQRATGEHAGLDIYAPVGTPIYACVDGVIVYHQMYGAKAGFLTTLKGYYKGELYFFQYMHLMEIKNDRFRFYNNYKKSEKVINDGWLDYNELNSILEDPLVGETYKIFYNEQNKTLQIDKNIIDIKLAIDFTKKYNECKINKKPFQVKKGDIIGYTGSTGNSYQGKNKNHLHFGVKKSNGSRINPYELLKEYINLDSSGEETHRKQDGITPSGEW